MIPQPQTMRQKRLRLNQFIVGTGFRAGLLALTLVLMTCHVLKMSSVSTQGYQISKLQKQIQQLEDDKQKIDIDVAKLSSMTSIQERIQQMQMVPVEKPQYLTYHGSSVAQR